MNLKMNSNSLDLGEVNPLRITITTQTWRRSNIASERDESNTEYMTNILDGTERLSYSFTSQCERDVLLGR